LLTDIISCPGLDYCALATARFDSDRAGYFASLRGPERQRLIGKARHKDFRLHQRLRSSPDIGAIGILGLEKKGQESYLDHGRGDPSPPWRSGVDCSAS